MTTNALPSKIKFGKKLIDTIEFPADSEKREVLIWDEAERGLGLRITAHGGKSYVFQGRVQGQSRRVTIGQCDAISLTQARAAAAGLRNQFHEGIDPKLEKQREAVRAVTLKDIRTRYCAEKKTRNGALKDSTKQSILMLSDRYFSDWLDKPVIDITRGDVVERFRSVSEKAPVMANLSFRYLRALLNFAQEVCRTPDDKPMLTENPVSVLKGASLWNPEKARKTRIPTNRVGAVWHHLAAARESGGLTAISETANDLVRFLLLTGCRFSEAAMLTWSDVDLVGKFWRINDSKNHSFLTLPLSSPALALLENRKRVNNEYVFPARSGKGCIKDVGTTTDKLAEPAGIRITPHDLRRTFTAICHECGIELWRTELLTGHVPTAITLTAYSETSDLRYLTPEAEKVGAWIIAEAGKAERQAEIDAAVASGDNVIRLGVAA